MKVKANNWFRPNLEPNEQLILKNKIEMIHIHMEKKKRVGVVWKADKSWRVIKIRILFN